MEGDTATAVAIGMFWVRVRNVSPLVLLIKLGLEESKMLGIEETKEPKKYY
jgi:hypothetical protein